MTSKPAAGRPFLLDVSRLIWRAWSKRLPTGIDRVCLAYLAHFKGRALAVIQRGDMRLVLNPKASDALFALLLGPQASIRQKLSAQLAKAVLHRERRFKGKVYLNVGHTGLDAAGLPRWLKRHGLKPVFLVHDLIPITHPHFCRAGEEIRHQRRMRHLLQSAQGIIANSADTLNALNAFAQAEGLTMANQQLVALLGTEKHPEAPTPPDLTRPYFVMIGTIEARKNHALLLDVWQQLINELGKDAPMLVLIGQRGWEASHVFDRLDHDTTLKDHVMELSRCRDSDMLGLVQGSKALLMPSFAEGFGLPVIEAMQGGTPVIASNLPVFQEIAGDIPAYLDPEDTQAWIETIKHYAADGTDRARQKAALTGYQPPNWPEHFARVDDWLKQL